MAMLSRNYWQCAECGYRVNGGCDPDRHECDERSVIRHQMSKLESTLAAYMDSPQGKFAQYYAERSHTEYRHP